MDINRKNILKVRASYYCTINNDKNNDSIFELLPSSDDLLLFIFYENVMRSDSPEKTKDQSGSIDPCFLTFLLTNFLISAVLRFTNH